METQQFTKRSYTRTQVSLLTRAMLIAGGFFILIGLGSWGLSLAFTNVVNNPGLDLGIFFLVLFGGMVVSMLITSALAKSMMGQGQGTGLIILGYTLYSGIMATTFGFLFAIIQHQYSNGTQLCFIAFIVTGLVFLLATIMAQVMSLRGVFTMGKMIGATAIAMAVMMIVFMILGIVGVAARSAGTILASNAVFNFIMIALAFVSFLYIVIDIWSISKSSQFIEYTCNEGNVPAAFVWYCGYKLLTDLLNLLLIVIMFILRYVRADR